MNRLRFVVLIVAADDRRWTIDDTSASFIVYRPAEPR